MAAEVSKPNDNTQALVARVREGSLAMQFGQAGLQLRHLEDAIAFAKQMIEGGLCPRGINKPGAVIWMVQRGAELGIGPTAAMDSFYIGPSGKPELYAKAALGICVARGVLDENYELWTEGEGKATVAYFKFRRRNWKEPRERKFAWKEAETAQLCKPDSNWLKWPQRMCQARVIAFAIKDFFADVTLGCALEGDHESEPLKAEVTELSREPLSAAPDPLFAQLEEGTLAPLATWDEVLDAPKVEPEGEKSDREFLEAGNELYEPPPAEPPIVTKPKASKKDCDFFYGLARSRGLTDIQIAQQLGTHGYESIDQVPEAELQEMTAKLKAYKPKTPATGNRT